MTFEVDVPNDRWQELLDKNYGIHHPTLAFLLFIAMQQPWNNEITVERVVHNHDVRE